MPADPSSAAPADPAPADPAPVDKRRLRAEQGRERVVEALLAFFAEGETQPGAARIAERAGVSERSVFRYFDDLDALAAETVKRQIERVRDIYAPPPATGDLDARVDAIVEQRLRIHAEVAVASEAARRIEPRAESVHRALARRGQLLRDQVGTQFARELDREPARSRGALLDALDAALAFEQIDQLRRIAGHSPARVRALTRRTLHALLTH